MPTGEWRREPEIDESRQAYLAKRRTVTANVSKGIFPFAGLQLTRADVEWLLFTHEQGLGPADWSDPAQRDRRGLDLRGAILQDQDLRGLPLARLCGGFTASEWQAATKEQRGASILRLERADLSHAHLEGAIMTGAVLYAAHLTEAHLEESQLGVTDLMWSQLENAHMYRAQLVGSRMAQAYLPGANLQEADLSDAQLQGAQMGGVCLYGAMLGRAHLQGAYLHSAELAKATFNATRSSLSADEAPRVYHSGAHLEGATLDWVVAQAADLRWAHLEGVSMCVAQLEGANLSGAFLDGANLSGCYLEGANLRRSRLEGVNFSDGRRHRARDAAHLEGADLSEAVLEGACLRGVHLAGAILKRAYLQRADLRGASLEGKVVPPEDLEFIRIGCPTFPATLPAAVLEGAEIDETTALPSRPCPASRYPGEGAFKLGRSRPRGGGPMG